MLTHEPFGVSKFGELARDLGKTNAVFQVGRDGELTFFGAESAEVFQPGATPRENPNSDGATLKGVAADADSLTNWNNWPSGAIFLRPFGTA